MIIREWAWMILGYTNEEVPVPRGDHVWCLHISSVKMYAKHESVQWWSPKQLSSVNLSLPEKPSLSVFSLSVSPLSLFASKAQLPSLLQTQCLASVNLFSSLAEPHFPFFLRLSVTSLSSSIHLVSHWSAILPLVTCHSSTWSNLAQENNSKNLWT